MRKINGSIIALNRKAFLLLSVLLSVAAFGVLAWRINAQRAGLTERKATLRQDVSALSPAKLARREKDAALESQYAGLQHVPAGVAEQFSPDETQGPNPLIFAFNSEGDRLVSFNANTPDTLILDVQVTGIDLAAGDVISGIDFRPSNGQLYGIVNRGFPGNDRVVTINTTTGAVTFVNAATVFPTTTDSFFGTDFNPVPDLIRQIGDADTNRRINPTTGALAGTDTPLAYAAGDPGAGVNPNIPHAAYSNNFAGATSTTLYGIDVGRNTLVRIGSLGGTPTSPNTGQVFTIGPLGVDPTNFGAFDIQGADLAFAILNIDNEPTAVRINLTTGAATVIGVVNTGGARVDGMAIALGGAPSPTPTVAPSPTPTVAPSPTPTVAPSPTPTVAPSPTPTVAPSPSPTPTVVPTPTPTPTPSPSPSPTPTNLLQFSGATFTDDESQSVTVTVTRTGQTTGASTATVTPVTGGTATGGAACGTGVDYVNTPQTVTFAANSTTAQTITIPLCGDLVADTNETIRLSITGPNTGTGVGTQGTATVTINDTANQFKNPAPISIFGGSVANPYPSAIVVSGATTNTFRIRVTLYDYYHELPDNVDVLLVGPNGGKYILMADVGGPTGVTTNNAVTLTFADYPNAVIPDGGPLVTGIFKPTSCETPVSSFSPAAPPAPYVEPGCTIARSNAQTLFGTFGGSTANGTWNLYIRDDAGQARPLATDVLRGEVKGGWGIELLPSTAAGVEVSGKVLTADGRGVRNATVIMTDAQGNRRTATTGAFGYYRFDDVEVGSTMIMSVESKRYNYNTRLVQVFDTLTELDFAPQE